MIEPPLELHSTLREVLVRLIPDVGDYGFIHMLEEEGAIREVAVRHRDGARESRLRRALRTFRPRIGGPGSLVHRVVESGEPERIEGPAARRAFEEVAGDEPEDLALIREFLPRAYLVLPLEHDARVFGTVSLARAETNLRFTDREIVLLRGAAAQAALAIRNAFLLEGAVGTDARRETLPTAPDRGAPTRPSGGPPLHPHTASCVAAAVADLVAARLRDLKEDLVLEMVDRSAAGSTDSSYHEMVRRLDRTRAAVSGLVRLGRRQLTGDRDVRLNGVVRSVSDRLEQRARDGDVELALDLDPNVGEVRTDADALGRALLALLAGMLDAAPPGARLRVRTSRERIPGGRAAQPAPLRPGVYGCIEVEGVAPGPGAIGPDRLLELFDGSGEDPRRLGLLAAYGAARLSGGALRVEAPGDGRTRTRIVLPAAGAEERAARTETPGARSRSDARPATVLLLEGQAGEREAAVRLLHEAGLRVLEAGDEAEARHQWETSDGEVDAFILDADAGAGGSDAEEANLVEHLRMIRPELPVLFSSRTPGMERALVRMSDRHTHFIGKPFTRDRLMEKLREALPERLET